MVVRELSGREISLGLSVFCNKITIDIVGYSMLQQSRNKFLQVDFLTYLLQDKLMIYGEAGLQLLIFFLKQILAFTIIYFGKPRGFGHNEKGEDITFKTEVYSASQTPD